VLISYASLLLVPPAAQYQAEPSPPDSRRQGAKVQISEQTERISAYLEKEAEELENEEKILKNEKKKLNWVTKLLLCSKTKR